MNSVAKFRIFAYLLSAPRALKKTIVIFVDSFLCCISTWLAFCLRLEDWVQINPSMILAAIFSILLVVPIFIRFGLYRAIFRYSGWLATISLIKAISVYAALYILTITIIGVGGVPGRLA